MTDSLPLALVVGLGNPGPEYRHTRHNAGFWLVDRLAQQGGALMRHEGKFVARVGKVGEIWLIQPETFMNRSGRSVSAIAQFYKLAPEQILVAHDELDLPPGEAKLKLGGGNAGHNGLRDIAAQLGTPMFWRLRLGIGHPRDQAASKQEVVDYVLHPPRAEDQGKIDNAILRFLEVWPLVRSTSMERAMHQLHTKSA